MNCPTCNETRRHVHGPNGSVHLLASAPDCSDIGFPIEQNTAEQTRRTPHCCPVCAGTTRVMFPPWAAAGDFYTTESGPWPCQVCGATGVIWDPPGNKS
jgi:hypothetical protein